MTRRKIADSVAASVIVAVVVVGAWSARPLAHDDHSQQGTSTGASHDHPHGALVQAVREATEAFQDPAFAQAAGYTPLFGCVSGPDRGAMGQHFVNFPLVGRRPARCRASRTRDLRDAAQRTPEATYRRARS